MTNYSDYSMLEGKIRQGMVKGTRHLTRRDVGRIVGGCLASGRITASEADSLRSLAIQLSSDGEYLGTKEWDEAVAFGREQPLESMSTTLSAGHSSQGRAIDWDEEIDPADFKIVDRNWLERETVVAPSEGDFNPCRQLADYLRALFRPDEKVVFCTQPFEIEGELKPTRGDCRTVEEMLKSLAKETKDGFEEAVGTPNEKSGAWIRINPFDGERDDKNKLCCNDAHVTAFRHALVESDAMSVEEQVAIYRKLELPCAAIVHSGSKSAHAIVRIDAPTLDEYRKRVDFLFKILSANGLEIDRQNRNPSRYSRLPGAIRDGKKQFLISGPCGRHSWDEWREWIESLNDDFPEIKTTSISEFRNPPPLDSVLIDGVMRVNDKMCVAGPSKAGKSFFLIELMIAIAEGREWLDRKCRQGRVLYVNVELTDKAFLNRLVNVYRSKGIEPMHIDFIDRVELRGRTKPLDKLAPQLVRRAKQRGYALIIFDPIYKIFTGDENSSADVAAFMSCIDRIMLECQCAVVYCHHHSKGAQGGKNAIDRASGSGVIGRDVDALIDLLPLDAETAKEVFRSSYECDAIRATVLSLENGQAVLDQISQDDQLVPNRFEGALQKLLDPSQVDSVIKARQAVVQRFDSCTAWRASFTLREFASPAPQNMWFLWPCHVMDEEDNLKDAQPEGIVQSSGWRGSASAKSKKPPKPTKSAAFKAIVEADPTEVWTLTKAAERFSVSKRTIERYCSTLGWTVDKGVIVSQKSGEEEDVPF